MPRRADVMLASDHAETQQGGVLDGIDQYELPVSTVTRIAKAALPPNAKLQKESVLALVKGSTVFINYIGAAAQEVATARGHKTITAADVLQALELAEFGDMVTDLTAELEQYRIRMKKNPPPKKDPPPPTTAVSSTTTNKGKGKAATKGQGQNPAQTATGSRTQNGKGTEPGDLSEEEAYSEPDVPGDDEEGGETLETEDQEAEPDDDDMVEDDAEEEIVDQMELDEQELAKDARGLDHAKSDQDDND